MSLLHSSSFEGERISRSEKNNAVWKKKILVNETRARMRGGAIYGVFVWLRSACTSLIFRVESISLMDTETPSRQRLSDWVEPKSWRP
jgi:hypothetical protein